MVVDPVCKSYHFCAPRCKTKFDQNPSAYVKQ
jgi:YHS domain-containing protein